MPSLSPEEYGPLLYGLTARTEPDRLWSLANLGELITAPATPLCWSVWHHGQEVGCRQGYADFGVLHPRDVPAPADPNGMLGSCFAGRIALNIDFTRGLMAAIPGASGDAFERDIVGKVRPGMQDRRDLSRLPALLSKAPVLLVRAGNHTRHGAQEMGRWWRRDVLAAEPTPDLQGAAARFDEALGRVRQAARRQTGSRLVVMSLQAQLISLCEKAGRPELANRILAGIGDTPEARLADELWLAGRGERTVADLLMSNGYYGVHVGNMTGRSWRQDPSLVEARIAAAAANPDRPRPRRREALAAADRRAAIEELRTGLPFFLRPVASRLSAAAATQFRILEEGKGAALMAADGCRAAAAEVGRHLVRSRVLDDPADVVFLRHDEFHRRDVHASIKERRAVWEQFAEVVLPTHFVGEPQVELPAVGLGAERVRTVSGAAGAGGVAEGRVRLVADAGGDIDSDEILVCPFTDPSWTPLMAQAAAVVIDIGGSASHGAVMARELGIPCVIGTENAMRTLRDGDTVRVDGTNGTVEVLAHADN